MKSRSGTIGIFFALATIITCPAIVFGQTADEWMARATDAYNKNDFDAAYADVSAAIKLQPNNATAYSLSGAIHYRQAKYDQAIGDESKAIQIDPKVANFYFYRGVSYLYKTNPELKLAIADFDRAIPNFQPAYVERGNANFQIKDFAAADRDYTLAINSGDNSKQVYNHRADANYELKNYDQAAADYRKVLTIDPTDTDVKGNLDIVLKMPTGTGNAGAGTCAVAAERLSKGKDLITQAKYKEAQGELSAYIFCNPYTANGYTQRSRAYILSNNAEAAYADAGVALILDPNDNDAMNVSGLALNSVKSYSLAIATYSMIIARDPKFAKAYYNRGTSYIEKKEYDKALADTAKALEFEPNGARIYLQRARIYALQKKFTDAMQDYNKAIALDPKSAQVYIGRGAAYQTMNDLESAFKDYNQAIALDPKNPTPYVLLAEYYVSKKDNENAILSESKAIEISPTYAQAFYKRALLYADANKWNEAFADIDRAVKLGYTPVDGYSERGYILEHINRPQEAIADYRKVLEIDPNNKWAQDALESAFQSLTSGLTVADLLKRAEDARKGKDDLAEEHFLTAALKSDTKNVDAYLARLQLYVAMNKPDLAFADNQQLVNLLPTHWGVYLARGTIYGLREDYAQEIQDLTLSLTLNPTADQSADVYYARGDAYRKIADYDHAIADLSKAVEARPSHTQALADRGLIYEYQGNYAAAEADLRKLLTIDPADKTAASNLEQIDLLKKAGFNTGKTKDDTLLKFDEYKNRVTDLAYLDASRAYLLSSKSLLVQKIKGAMSEINTTFEAMGDKATTPPVQSPADKAKVCGLVANADIALKTVEARTLPLRQLISSGKLDKLPTFKNAAQDLVKPGNNYRTELNKNATENGCALPN